MQERETRKCRSGTGIVMAFLAGAGVVTAAFMLARRFRETGTFLSINGIIDRCDEAASKLDDRLGDVDIALAG